MLAQRAGIDVADIEMFFHGTTVATNIVLEHNGSDVGMITTDGFRDLLHIARKKRPLNYSNYQDLPWQKWQLVPRRNRRTVPERIDAAGNVLTPLDEDAVRREVALLRERGVEAIAVAFLHAYRNPTHEQRVREIIAEEYPGVFVSLSSDVASQYREYERFSTTALNAFVGPKTSRYIENLAGKAKAAQVGEDVHLMTSAGGLVTSRSASEVPVSLLTSGVVAGLLGGCFIGRASGYPSVITLDVGGMFRVGPRSAGAMPGPACYNRGGTEPTSTDAMVVMGWLGADSFLSGTMEVKPELATEAVKTHIADKLGADLEHAAMGIFQILAHSMTEAISLHSVRKGYDPREFSLVAEGGAGPLYAWQIAEHLGIPRVIVPGHPGITSVGGRPADHRRALRGPDDRVDVVGRTRPRLAAPRDGPALRAGRRPAACRRHLRSRHHPRAQRRLPLCRTGLRASCARTRRRDHRRMGRARPRPPSTRCTVVPTRSVSTTSRYSWSTSA